MPFFPSSGVWILLSFRVTLFCLHAFNGIVCDSRNTKSDCLILQISNYFILKHRKDAQCARVSAPRDDKVSEGLDEVKPQTFGLACWCFLHTQNKMDESNSSIIKTRAKCFMPCLAGEYNGHEQIILPF